MSSGLADSYPRLVGDIGGTNARFALIVSPGGPIEHIATLLCAEHAGPLEAIRSYLAMHPEVPAPRNAAIGIANPITGDQLKLTNNPWAFSIKAVQDSLGLQKLIFLNDFTALALSIPRLSQTEFRQTGSGSALAGAPIGLIGPGTGLGVSGLIKLGGHYSALEGEGGHVSLSPGTREEQAILGLLMEQYSHVSAERLLSGPGLVTLHQALAAVRGVSTSNPDSPQITHLALTGQDALCIATLNTFCALLGSTAGNLALTLGARGGIFIGGGIVPRLGTFFDASPFRSRFESKGRFSSYLAAIPSFVITAANPALTGAALALEQAIEAAQP